MTVITIPDEDDANNNLPSLSDGIGANRPSHRAVTRLSLNGSAATTPASIFNGVVAFVDIIVNDLDYSTVIARDIIKHGGEVGFVCFGNT
jgi:hypothetical protein